MLPLDPRLPRGADGTVPGTGGPGAGRRAVRAAIPFVLGFACVFVVLGVAAGLLGSAFRGHRDELTMASGILVVAIGFALLGLLPMPALDRMFAPAARAGAPQRLARADGRRVRARVHAVHHAGARRHPRAGVVELERAARRRTPGGLRRRRRRAAPAARARVRAHDRRAALHPRPLRADATALGGAARGVRPAALHRSRVVAAGRGRPRPAQRRDRHAPVALTPGLRREGGCDTLTAWPASSSMEPIC